MARLLLVLLLCAWAAAYVNYSIADKKTCAEHGVPFGGESLSLDGYCLSGSIMVPVENYR